jgi:hypothetical protein
MDFILVTRTNDVQFYYFKVNGHAGGSHTGLHEYSTEYELRSDLVHSEIPKFGDKKTAGLAAKALGLKSWRYMKIG